MPRAFRTLVDAATLARHLDDPRWVVVDCRWQLTDPRLGPRRYAEGHIPGARYADLDTDLSGPRTPHSGRHPLPDPAAFARRAGGWGIGDDVQVVAYDDAGGAYAARLWWLLRWLGHDAVAVLDGGITAWTAAGGALEREPPTVSARHFRGAPDDARWLDSAEVEAALADPRRVLLDARGAARYSGAEEPIDPKAGHIPGAASAPFTGNLDADGRFLPATELKARFAALLGGRSADAAVVYCGSGVTACQDLLALEHAGLPGAQLYAGSWSEWVRDDARPVRVGDQP
jgi:thiosulfate/3-mercaptopyruvate sulfurtransferase